MVVRNLVLGSDGFVGDPFCEYLESNGEEVVRLDLKRNPLCDLRFIELPLDLNEISQVYFFAWEVGGSKYLYIENSQTIQLCWNVRLLLNIMPQLQKYNTPFLFISSQLAEDTDSVYGVTKRLGEVWSKALGGSRVRLWNIYGSPEKPSKRSHVVADFIHQALTCGEITMMTTGEEKRQFVYFEDANRAFHMTMFYHLQGVYDVTSFEWVKVIDVAKLIGEMTGAKVYPGKNVGSTQMTAMSGKIPGWRSEVSLEDGLAKQIIATKMMGISR